MIPTKLAPNESFLLERHSNHRGSAGTWCNIPRRAGLLCRLCISIQGAPLDKSSTTRRTELAVLVLIAKRTADASGGDALFCRSHLY